MLSVGSSPSPSRKRARIEEDGETSVESFEILPCPHSHLDKPTTLLPLCTLRRADLPLSWLDSRRDSWLLPSCRFFSAYIPQLEDGEGHALTTQPGPAVLIVTTATVNDAFYAIQRVHTCVYTACRLGPWVKRSHLKRLALLSTPQNLHQDDLPEQNRAGFDWWKSISSIQPSEIITAKKRRLELTEEVNPTSTLVDSTANGIDTAQLSSIPLPLDSFNERMSIPLPMNPQEAITKLVNQYLEALYLSGSSLAYFAKGPLSRARTCYNDSGCLEELSLSLRQLVLTVPLAEEKFKEALPAVLSQIPTQASPRVGGSSTRKTKKQSRPTKRAKNGLLPNEAEYIGRWWVADDMLEASSEMLDNSLRARISKLRFRETLLQVVLILETLSIEATCSVRKPDVALASPANKSPVAIDPQESKDLPKPRTKKLKDLSGLAETLIDRLTIWQSIESVSAEKQAHESGPHTASLTPTSSSDGIDRVKEFGSDVVVPFYSSRLPSLVGKLKEKMGLPSARPPKLKGDSLPRPPTKPAPGTILTRGGLVEGRKPLTRVSSESSKSRPIHPPTLIRSATDSSLQNIKREPSTTPQSPISFNVENARPASRGSISHSVMLGDKGNRRSLSRSGSITLGKSFSNREIDMSAITKFNQARAKRKIDVEEELKGAIAALKKPNRVLAVKELVKDAEARVERASKPRVSSIRKSYISVEVNATPKRTNKNSHLVSVTPARTSHAVNSTPSTQPVPSSMPCIPSSTLKSRSKVVASILDRSAEHQEQTKANMQSSQPTDQHVSNEPRSIYDTLGWNNDDIDELM